MSKIDSKILNKISQASAKLLIEKWEMQIDKTYSDVKYSVKDQTYMTVDAHTLKAADDVVVSYQTVLP